MNQNQQGYRGLERRRHKVLLTRNTEYHFRDGLCVAVRDRTSGVWIRDHVAINRPVTGSLTFAPNGGIRPNLGKPKSGEALLFATGGRDVVTSAFIEEVRPAKRDVDSYPNAFAVTRRRTPVR